MSQNHHLSRFLSDFTLGFSDGLTVPFALTAGLSSLGRSDTVINAGLAELCAGSISMGIGGYLSAKDDLPSESLPNHTSGDEEEMTGMLHEEVESRDNLSQGSLSEKITSREAGENLVKRHLQPLGLSRSEVSWVVSVLHARSGGIATAARSLQSQSDAFPPAATTQEVPSVMPVVSGLSISAGYVVGGIIPLFPYFLTETVGLGLRWSIVLCLLALFSFGSGKSWILSGRKPSSWKHCLWEGAQMLVLGTLAAVAAVLCVQLVGSSEGDTEG